ncbi:nikel transport family protein NikM [Vibrio maritimus]|uniref:Nikel transport family protein NikM n=1 Tax=Vibrio maritimus TaxID=990268 RepID=A0A090RSE9_9VIBR|nr:nikel transport family protein NikM [Vibrio maritimus]
MKMKTLASSLIAAALLVPSITSAHPLWLLPSHFTVSKTEGDWVTVDVTASHGTFVFDKAAPATNAYIVMPDGSTQRPDHVLRGKRRSVFDFFFVDEGTHKIVNGFDASYWTTYKIGGRDTVRRLRGSKAEVASQIPEGAREVTTIRSERRSESYVTVMGPTTKAIEPKGKGFELYPVTHPADIVENEETTFQFFFNGEPLAGVESTITRDGTLYRPAQDEITVVSDSEGKVTFTLDQAGRYVLQTSSRTKLDNDPLADAHSTMLSVTFEAQLD